MLSNEPHFSLLEKLELKFRKPKNKWDVASSLIDYITKIDKAIGMPVLYYGGLEKAYGIESAKTAKEDLLAIRERAVELLKLVLNAS